MKELVIISGKGGTGKTSVTASFAALAHNPVLADCDVDAADLHLVLEPRVQRRESFSGGFGARIDPERCTACGKCKNLCRFDAIHAVMSKDGRYVRTFEIDPYACEGCGVCSRFCTSDAVEFGPVATGEWCVSETRYGPMVHARLNVASQNSGKLVAVVRREARALAESQQRDLVVIDGPPGVGCPVIASITGASHVLAVTEPSVAGEHDLERVLQLAAHFRIPASIVVNKWDLNPEMTERIERRALEKGANAIGRIRYDRTVTEAQRAGVSVVAYDRGDAAEDIRKAWGELCGKLS